LRLITTLRRVATHLRDLPRNVWAVTLTSLLTDVSSEMLVWLMPFYLSDVLGAKTAVIGLIEGVAETTAGVLKVVSGRVSDRIGRRKGLAVVGYALSTAARPFLLVASSWSEVLAVRLVDRTGKGIRTAPRDALVADSTPPKLRGLAFGIHRAGDTLGAVVGVAVALAVVATTSSTTHVLSRETFRTLVVACVAPAILATGVLAVVAREPDRRPRTPNADRSVTVSPLERPFFKFLGVAVLFALGNSSDAFLVLRARQAGLPLVGVLGMMLSFNVVYAAASGPLGALSDRLGRRRVMVAGWVLYAAVYLGFALASTGVAVWMLMGVYGLYYAATEGVAKALVADLVAPEHRGTAYGVYNAAVGLAALPASVIAGVLWQGVGGWSGFGPSAPFYFGAMLALAASGCLIGAVPDPEEQG
jgi:MFS family permease